MTTYEEGDGVLVVRRKARTGFLTFMGCGGVFIVVMAVLMAVMKILSPTTISVTCDRGAGTCTVSPISAGWSARTVRLDDLRTVHVEWSHRQWVLYAGPKDKDAAGRIQLSDSGEKAPLERAAKLLAAFPDATAPTLAVSYPAGGSMAWYTVVFSLLFGVVWVVFYARSFKAVEVRLDRGAGTITAVWSRALSGRAERNAPLASIGGVRTVGAQTKLNMVSVGLCVEGEPDLVLLREGAFASVRAEAYQLATRLAAFLQVSVEGD